MYHIFIIWITNAGMQVGKGEHKSIAGSSAKCCTHYGNHCGDSSEG